MDGKETRRGLTGHQPQVLEGVAGPIGGVCVVTSRHKTQDVTRAHHRHLHLRGRRVRCAHEAYLSVSAMVVKNVYSVKFSLAAQQSSQQVQFQKRQV